MKLASESGMNLPKLSHLQFLVIKMLLKSRLTRDELRMRLASEGIVQTNSAFSQLMSRMTGFVDQSCINGNITYETTLHGCKEWANTMGFYARIGN